MPPITLFDRAQAAATYIRARAPHLSPAIAIILGSGLGNFADRIAAAATIPFAEIPHFPRSTVAGHSGNLVLGTLAGIPVAAMQGRVHAYEGYTLPEVTFPTRVLGLLGCRTLIVTNAAGGIKPGLPQGGFTLITDHINLTGSNAAAGPNESRFALTSSSGDPLPGAGERFFDMTTAYSPDLRALALAEAARQQIPLGEGVYLAVLGPSFETPAEIRAFRTLGADLVGMSTVHEVIVARHMGLDVLGLSLVTNVAAGLSPGAIDHHDVMEVGRNAERTFAQLITALLPCIADRNR